MSDRRADPAAEPRPERGILVGVTLPSGDPQTTAAHLDELGSLLAAAGGREAGRVTVRRRSVDPATFIGAGKVEELASRVRDAAADLVVFDDDLSPGQAHKLEDRLGVRVVDRSGLILDIFARRARSREARTQVELAQLRYLLPRLPRRWTHLSRQEGGIGVRGVGETQLEIDRRLARRRIARLEEQLVRIDRARTERRKGRRGTYQAALVGYTNAGKTTLLNVLTHARAHTEDRPFATLDPLVRRMAVPGARPVLLIDTVGFVRKLPHDLVASFRSTLGEAAAADLLVHVIDLSQPDFESQAGTVRTVLADLGLSDRPVLEVFNKIDRVPQGVRERAARLYPRALFLSALRREGLGGIGSAIASRAARSPRDGAGGATCPGTTEEDENAI